MYDLRRTMYDLGNSCFEIDGVIKRLEAFLC